MPRPTRAPRRLALATIVAATLAASLTACAAPRPDVPRPATVELAFLGDPASVLEMLRDDATARGGFIHHETADTLSVDFGVRPCILENGPAGAAAVASNERTTEIHVETTYRVRRAAGGTSVTVEQATTWWHPDRRVWLPLREFGPSGKVAAAQMSLAR